MASIRKATLMDLHVLWPLWLALTSEECANEATQGREMYPAVLLDDQQAWAMEYALAMTNPNVCLLLAESSGAPVGFMLSSINSRQVGHPKNYVHVHSLYVRPSERKRAGGTVAEQLQQSTEEWARANNVLAIEIDCVQSNQSRWAKQGFLPAAVRMYKTLEEIK